MSTTRPRQNDPPIGVGVPGCPTCNGLGFYRVDRDINDPRFGQAEPCTCYLERERFKLAGIPKGAEYEAMTLDNLSGDIYKDIIEKVKALAEGTLEHCFIVIGGTSGLGKTHVAIGATKYALERGIAATFLYTSNFIDSLKRLISAEGERPEDLRDRIAELPFLVLDDFGVERAAEKPSPWVLEQYDVLVNTRYVQHLPTIFTTNLSQMELPMRIQDRLFDTRLSLVVNLAGPSYRSGESYR